MPSHISRLIYKIVLILTVFALMVPAPVFAMPIEQVRPAAPSATYTVDSIADDGSSGTLRWAITQANANTGIDTIDFAIDAVGSQQTITLTAALPDITDPVIIDGWSQGGASYTGAPLIELNGTSAGTVNGLTLSGGDSIVRGFVINRFGSNGIAIFSANNKIQGNYIGTDASGASAQGNAGAGVLIYSGSGNIIGTDGDGVNDAVERNIISGNAYYGLNLNGGDGNVVAGNFIGLNAAGTAAVGNLGAGITIFTSNNRIGTNADGVSDAAERNIISGQIDNSGAGQPGIGIQTVGSGTGNVIAGNTIGLNAAGTAALGNPSAGVWLGSNGNLVGTNGDGIRDAVEGNVISANQMGIRFLYSQNNVAAGNFIGTDVTGVTAIPNAYWGVYFDGGSNNRLGTNGDGIGDVEERNIVSGNGYDGIVFVGGSDHIVTGNYVGLNVNGAPLGNANNGVSIGNGASSNRIGTDGSNDIYNVNEGNAIAANNGQGIQIFGATSNNNIIAGNLIGVNPGVTTTSGYGNAGAGVDISQSSGNRVGTNSDGIADAEEANVIGGNGFTFFGGGVSISEGNNNTVAGNFIGTDASNTLDLGNNRSGIILHGGSQNTIGGSAIFAGNIIRNGKNSYASGIELYGYNAQTTGNAVIGNTISNNPFHGIENLATETYPGSTSPGDGLADNTILSNTITYNGGYGIHDYGSSPEIRGNVIQYNQASGIYNEVNFGNGADPATAGDDYLSRPNIISNTVYRNCQSEAPDCGGIISLDTAPANAATLEADNTPASNIGPFIAQRWYGAAEVIQGSTPLASSVALDDNAGGSRTLSYSTGPCSNLNNTIIHGDQYAVSCTDVTSWPQFTEYEVEGDGVRTDYMPVTSTSPATAVYSFDADAATHPADTGAGFVGEGLVTGPFSRYQIMQVTIVPQPIVGLTAINDSPTILGNTTNFTATVTSGDNIVYSWAFGDGNTGTGQYPAHTYGAVGYYTAIVTATNSVSTMTATTPVTITELPIVNLVASNDSPTILGNTTNFTATVTSGDNIVYSWAFGDGNTGTGQYPAHTYGVPDYYTAIVTATNSVSTLTATTSVTITASCTSGLVVENTNDAGCGSLRYAVGIAVPGDTVTFAPTLAGQTITLTTGQIVVDKSITIDGATVPGVTVSGNDNDRVFNVYAQSEVTLNALIIVHGWVGEDTGAGINNAGTLTVRNSTVAYNDGMIGGGIYNGGTLTLLNSTVNFNLGYEGSGFYNDGVATVLNDTFAGNQASTSGGGVYNGFNAVMTMTNSTLSTNSVTNVEMAKGGGLYNNGSLSIVNSTFYSNTSSVNDSGGGLFNQEGADLSLANTVIAHSSGGDCLTWNTITSNVNNLIEDGSCAASLSGDPLLGSLANNGGPTLTHLPQTGSPLIDAGDDASVTGLTYDQRGVGFPRVVNSTVDIGAVEVAAEPPTLTASNDSPTLLGTATNLTATLTGVMSNPTFTWDFGDGLAGVGQTVAHTYGAVGFYTAIVTATDSKITLTATTCVTITELPLLNLVAINDSPTPLGNTTNLLASVQGNSATFTWSFGDGTIGTGQSPAHVYGAVGFYTALVTATNSVSTLTTTTRVTITDQPILNLTAVNDSPTVLGNTTQLTATASGSSIVYTWAFGDGATGVGQTPTHVYAAAGMYTAVVTATNSISTVVATTPVTVVQPKHYTTYLPLLMRNFFTAPELIVQSVAASSDVITVVIKNIGDAPAPQAFWVDAYVDPNPPPTAVNQIWWDQNRSEQGVAWAVDEPITPLEPGAVITLTSRDPNVSPMRTLFLGNLPVGTPIYAQVDSYNYQTDYGAVQERQEILGLAYDNILGPVYSTAGTTPHTQVINRLIVDPLKSALPYRPLRP